MRQGLIFKLSAGLICVAMAAFASPALAKKHKKRAGLGGAVTTVTATGNVAPVGQLSTAVAACPSGTQAVGGGFSAPVSGPSIVAVISSMRSSPQTWTATGEPFNSTAAITAYAYCRTVTKTTVSDVAATASVPATPTGGTATATCPTNTKLIGGGFETTRGSTPSDVVVPQDNLTTSAGVWTVRALSNSASSTQTVTAHAYCAGKLREPQLVSASSTATVDRFDNGGPPVTATTPACPPPPKPKHKKKHKKHPPRRLSDGGFSTPVGGQPTIFVESHAGGGGGWQATAVGSLSGPHALQVTSQGICA